MTTHARNPVGARDEPRRQSPLKRWARAAAVAALAVFFGASPSLAKYASLVMDAETGRVIHSVNADTRNYPASLTKMMTLYLVFEALKKKTWTIDTRLRISARAARQPASRLGLHRGGKLTVEDAVLALVTKSANDVATVIAENMAGSERTFALKMTAKARQLGMTRTTFRNASGLPHRGQLSTARDMAALARALIRDFPIYYRYFSTTRFVYDGAVHRNHNKLLHTYDGADGIKTGYINASGFNLVASADREGHRVIGVIFGGNSPNSRNKLMTRLLNLGFKSVNKRNAPLIAKAMPGNRRAAPPPQVPKGTPKVAEAESKPRFDKNHRWGVQVGAFARYKQAFAAARKAVSVAPSLLEEGIIKVVPLNKKNGRTLHRARIHGITKRQAYRTCRILKQRNAHCMEVRLRDGVQVASNER